MSGVQGGQKILGIDIGATSVKYAALASGGSLGERKALPIAASSNEVFIAQLQGIISDPVFADCNRIGIGSPGPLDIDEGIIIASANMPAIRNCKIVPELKKKFPQKEIRLDNDANAATLGEKYFGAGKEIPNFAVFTLGTGVGGGCVFENKLRRGYKGNFFEIGHIPIAHDALEARADIRDTEIRVGSPGREPVVHGMMGSQAGAFLTRQGRPCGCGNRGCLEAYASATGVSASYKEESGDLLTAEEIARRANAGDEAAIQAYAVAASALALGAATITQLMNITHFIFTGGMAAAENLMIARLEETYRAHTFALFHPLARFIFTRGDENAGIYGAAALFLE